MVESLGISPQLNLNVPVALYFLLVFSQHLQDYLSSDNETEVSPPEGPSNSWSLLLGIGLLLLGSLSQSVSETINLNYAFANPQLNTI